MCAFALDEGKKTDGPTNEPTDKAFLGVGYTAVASSKDERVFSVAGNVVTERRTCLTPEKSGELCDCEDKQI